MRNRSNRGVRRRLATASALLSIAIVAGDARAQPIDQSTHRHVLAQQPTGETILIKATAGLAVIRAAKGPIERVSVGDRIGLTKAVVAEISAGRLVLEEVFTGKDGKPNRASIVIMEGERGGTRYLRRIDELPLTGSKPLVVMPVPDVARPAPKKPPQM